MSFVLIPTILCGGAGSRLWPVSREQHPKPFIALADGQTLLQKAFLRGASIAEVAEVLTVTNRELLFKTEDNYAEVNAENKGLSFILEPFGRNTAAAAASAALYVQKRHGNDALMLVLAADHLISKPSAFATAVKTAAELALQGKLVTFGIQPRQPETGYGYIEAQGNTVLRFVEKPSIECAQEYVSSGKYLWNSGMFCFSAGTLIQEMKAHCPDVMSAVEACLLQSREIEGAGYTQLDLDKNTFATVPDISIDYAVMEKSASVAVVPCDIGWSDIGSWTAMGELGEQDASGNTIEGETVLHDVSGCYIRSEDRLVGAVGVHDLVIVDTPDAVLVADKNHVQGVKQLYNNLKKRNHQAYKIHRTVHRPWGTYTVLEDGDRFKIKRIIVKPGQSLSLQMHHHRSEHWIVVRGAAQIINGELELFVSTNESTYIPAGHKHRLTNPGVIDLVLIEVQSGEYLGEDDIVRYDDIYGRC
ncbi:mannose-1-phosphate guanylyltransferase/mannose-6-phosphate isomerase [Aquitalea aquatilis]|uniref:mannose-1-phosphate guanylyltransferase/mannose-6-phosphate isomerase n=1 Tax=Aquitalea aquatilis TaxID=1537400 RepID=UPI0010BD5B74|nr:mannose-1-phosphate guanylyltransferase/mannose-6-phosphate isomerase [Aquitalea aquatilis]